MRLFGFGGKLRRRYGRSHGAGYVEAALKSDGRWLVVDRSPGGGIITTLHTRGEAISRGQSEAKKRGVRFVMGI